LEIAKQTSLLIYTAAQTVRPKHAFCFVQQCEGRAIWAISSDMCAEMSTVFAVETRWKWWQRLATCYNFFLRCTFLHAVKSVDYQLHDVLL